MSHRYTVEVRFYGDLLDPSAISKRLRLEPSNSSANQGSGLSNGKRQPFWGYNGHGQQGFSAEWESLDEGLNFLVGRLLHVRPDIVDLSESIEGIWWCGHFQSSFDGGPTLSSKTLASVASFGLPIFLDNYFSDDS